MRRKPVILFDSECPICEKIKQLICLVDYKDDIEFRSIHEEKIYDEIPGINYWDCRKTVHLVDENNQVYTGEAVIEFLFDRYRLSSKFSRLYKSTLGRWALKAFYDELNELRKSRARARDCETCQH